MAVIIAVAVALASWLYRVGAVVEMASARECRLALPHSTTLSLGLGRNELAIAMVIAMGLDSTNKFVSLCVWRA